MCFVLYMASDQLRREIPWDEQIPRFHVKRDDADAQKTRQHFSKGFIHYLGSSDGCGCGFRREPGWVLDQIEQESMGKEKVASCEDNQRRLHDYLIECLQDEVVIELFGCWGGDEELPAEKSRTVDVNTLVSKDFWFEEREKIIITKGEPASAP